MNIYNLKNNLVSSFFYKAYILHALIKKEILEIKNYNIIIDAI